MTCTCPFELTERLISQGHVGVVENKKAIRSRFRDYKIVLKQPIAVILVDCVVVIYFLYASVLVAARCVI